MSLSPNSDSFYSTLPEKYIVQHLRRMEFPTSINKTGLFPFKGLYGGILHFYSNFNSIFCEQTVETLIRRHTRRLIWVCNVCLCPTKIWVVVVVLVFNVPPTAKVIWRRGHGLKSHPTDW